MLFTDPLFLFYFLPVTLVLLRVAASGNRFTLAARWTVILATLVFYAYQNWLWCGLFLGVVGGIYLCTLPILRAESRTVRKISLGVAITFAVSALGFFKYLNWLVTLWPALRPVQNSLALYFGHDGFIILPPGISFYVFEALSFSIDAYRGRVGRQVRCMDYFSFLAMFPRFIAGPIVRYTEMAGQFATWSGGRYGRGLSLFALGFTLKSLFADQFAVFVPYAFGPHQPDFLQSWIGALAYTFQLYFDFWSYSIMATGLGLCLGFEFPDNFRSPYRATSIGDFWRRWHITLSLWLRDYLYISLGGNRCAPWRMNLNLMLTMTIAGLWHGANFTFVAWGAFHGACLVAERIVGENRLALVPESIRRIATFILVVLGWVLFRSDSFAQAGRVYAGLGGLYGIAPQFNPLLGEKHFASVLLVLVAIYFWITIEPRVVGTTPLATREIVPTVQFLLLGLFGIALVFSLSSVGIPFLYFQF